MTIVLTMDPPAKSGRFGEHLIQYCVPNDFSGSVRLRAYQEQKAGDSSCLYDLTFDEIVLKKGAGCITLNFSKCSRRPSLDASFFEAMDRLGSIPPGRYSASLSLRSDTNAAAMTRDFHWYADSLLVLQSPLRWQANDVLAAGSAHMNGKLKKRHAAASTSSDSHVPKRATNRLYRGLHKKGISVQSQTISGKSYTAFYYEKWFLGRYELAAAGDIAARAASEKERLRGSAASMVANNLEDFRSVSAQMRELNGAKRKSKGGTLDGTLELNNYGATGQEPGSGQDNNYVEVAGQISTELMDMPVGLEGYYTTQDIGRQAKASYIRVRYDAEKAKSELLQFVSDYKRKYAETQSKGKGLEQVYGRYLGGLQDEQTSLTGSLTKDYGIDAGTLNRYGGDIEAMLGDGALDTAAILGAATDKATGAVQSDSTAAARAQKLADAKSRLLKNKAEIQKRHDQLTALRQKTEKYRTLLGQYQDGVFLDSAIHGTRLQALATDKNASYKDMAKAASGLLPEGKAKRFASGLTHLEAGILNKQESAYTWAGQTAKGGSAGYDIGFAQVSATVGKTEYVSRSGAVDRYSAYSGRADFEPLTGQRLSMIYYGYSPSRSMLQDKRFNPRAVELALPTFTAPVHVLSILSEGTIAKRLTYGLEGAASHQRREENAPAGKPTIGLANSAIRSALEWAVPKTTAILKGEWESVGRDFQNSALPISRTGTTRYTLGGSVGLFRDFLQLGLQYNTLRQESFSSTGYSTRWGFDVRTRSKRYPNVALSYKPFATFRSYDDTLAIQQRPLVGEVWTARGTYHVKRPGGISHRFAVLYNRNSTTTGDTSDYRSATAQATYLYTSAGNTVTLNGGWMLSSLPVADGPVVRLQELRNYFLATVWSQPIGQRANANIGGDVALAPFGLQRLALTAGGAYALAKQPLSLRLQTRCTSFRTDEASDRSIILAAMIGGAWRFQASTQHKKQSAN